MEAPNNPVITAKQARQITGGRAPLVPVQYEQAVQALAECSTLDDAKVWSDKADALAAWAKIYRDDTVDRQARALKLHAYRRMGLLAAELRPPSKPNQGRPGMAPGPMSALRDAGLNATAAREARHIAKLPPRVFTAAVERPKVPSPSRLYVVTRAERSKRSDAWIAMNAGGLASARSFCNNNDARQLARGLNSDEAAKAREMVRSISDWLDEFERCLPRSKG